MAENIPLLPDKKNAVCADVRGILRETFRELDCLPSIINEQFGKEGDDQLKFDSDFLIKDLSKECMKLAEHEKQLQHEYAKRLAKDSLPNIYTLHSPRSPTRDDSWKQKFGLLQRKDLKPSVEQNANYDKSVWVQNILNRSSGDFTVLTKVSPITRHVPLESAHEYSLQSVSLGEIIPRAPPPPLLAPPPPEMPSFIACIPSRVEFVNFAVGKLYTQTLRLVNTSTVEISLSVRPPPLQDLRVELRSRLVVTSSAAAEIRVHFTPRSVRWVTEEVFVRASVGRSLVIPIRCYMEPPVLEILLRNVTSDTQTFDAIKNVQDVLDLGTKLLGDVHRKRLLFNSVPTFASFFILSEDSWQQNNIEVIRNLTKNVSSFGVVTDGFYISPAHWVGRARGLGCSQCTDGDCGCGLRGAEGLVAARLTSAGSRVADIRIVSSTGTVRSLNLVADALMFSPEHITIKAQEKDFDICSEGDPYCKYYIHLGTAFPNQSLSATVQVENHSPLTYDYYWSSRKWGEDVSSEDFSEEQESRMEFRVSVRENNDILLQHTRNPQSICAADCGSAFGTQKAVLMLIIKNIPSESLPSDFEPIIVDSYTVHEDAIPGISASWSREVCSVVCAQLEVWWEVVPVRFTVDPPFLRLFCSTRVNSISIPLRVTQLFGVTAIHVRRSSQKEPLQLTPGLAVTTTVDLPLQITNKRVTKVITFTSLGGEWSASSTIEYSYRPRGVTLQPATRLLRASPPNVAVSTDIALHNNTHQRLAWHATCHPWRDHATTCSGYVCSTCVRRDCHCAALQPAGGKVAHAHDAILRYKVTAPDVEGCFATLIEVTAKEKGEEVNQSPTANSAALVAYRVLAPRLFLRVVPCGGDERGGCSGCVLDMGNHSVGVGNGTAVLRPLTLRCNDRTCCRLRVWNITPISTRIVWEQCEDDALKVTFLPNEFEMEGFADTNIMVQLEPSKVCRRKLFACRALVAHAPPLYLLIDTAIAGVEVKIEFPVGEDTDSSVSFKIIQMRKSRTRKKIFTADAGNEPERSDDESLVCESPFNAREEFSNIFPDEMTTSIEDIFAKEDLKRAKQKQNICDCPKKMIYIPPVKKPQPPKGPDEYSPIEIVDTPPLTCVCRCTFCSKPTLPEQTEPYCLQFRKLPLNTVRSRTVVLRNEGGAKAQWRSAVRRWPRKQKAWNVPWSFAPGVALQCAPATGTLPPRGVVAVTVSICADSWGLYHDQIVIQVEHLEPIVIDVWIEVIGSPLQFALRPEADDDKPPVLWISASDPERSVRFTNTSRADLVIYPYLLKNHEYAQESLPFRLYLRLYDVLPPSCPCVTELQGASEETSKDNLSVEMSTNVELFLAPDYGVQDSIFYQVEPSQLQVKAQTSEEFRVRLLTPLREEPPLTTLLLRLLPVVVARESWYRPIPPPQLVHIRSAPRAAHLQASCSEIRISLCALDLPYNDVMRLRKHFSIRNPGECAVQTRYRTSPPWLVSRARCRCASAGMATETSLILPPHSSTEMFVEVSLSGEAWWPARGRNMQEDYPVRRIETDSLSFYDTDDVLLLTIPLVLVIDQPRVTLEPAVVDFGELGVGCTAKTYFTVAHSSPQATLEVVVSSENEQFRVFPRALELAPREKCRVYVQCTARYEPTTPGSDTHRTNASILVHARAAAAARGRTRRSESRQVHADYTDDMDLVPEDICELLNL